MTTMDIRIDAELRHLIPPLSKDERAQLEANVLRDGVLDPIKVWGGVILDGHNRYELAEEHGLEYDVDELEFESRDAARVWIIQHQLGRRNLTAFARTELATQLEGILKAQAKERMKAGGEKAGRGRPVEKGGSTLTPPIEPAKTRDAVAKAAGVSAGTVSKVKAIAKAHAAGKVDDETMDKLRSGEVSTNSVASKLKAAHRDDDEWEEVEDDLEPETLAPLSDKKFDLALEVLHRKIWDLIGRGTYAQLVDLHMKLQQAERTTGSTLKEKGK